jgi:ABC-type glycerol-3-phosphate transport system substrate-binding protein
MCPNATTSSTIPTTSSHSWIRTRAYCPRSNSWAACRPGPPGPGTNAPQAVDVFMQALASVVYGGQDAQQTMDAAATRVNQPIQDA